MSKSNFYSPSIYFLAAALLTTALYWQGFKGPFLMDDAGGLFPVRLWLEGDASLRDVLMGNTGWHTHRALAYATLALNGAIGGFTPFSFKVGNLLTHIACGALLLILVQRILHRDAQLRRNACVIALFVTAVWLLHPLNVSTVLYPIQRMAQIAALMTFAGLLFYLIVRERMLDGRIGQKAGMLLLWAGVPLFTFLGVQGKQNAAVLPALCLLVELAWLQRFSQWNRHLKTFYSIGVALPSLLALIMPVFLQNQLVSAFSDYDFTAGEKVLSAPRVIFDYIGMLLAPYSPTMGIFGDGFIVSRGLLSPPSTLTAWLGIFALTGTLWTFRKTAPGALAFWLMFLLCHAIEAGYTPIELYYEHRNYVAGPWLFLCAVSLINLALDKLAARGVNTARTQILLIAGTLTVLSIQTLVRNLIWQDTYTLSASAAEGNPDSLRAAAAYASTSADLGRFDDAFEAFERLGNSKDPTRIAQGILGKLSVQCRRDGHADPVEFNSALSMANDRIDLGTFYMVHIINQQRRQFGCGALDAKIMADGLRNAADRAVHQPNTTEMKIAVRYLSSVLYSDADMPHEASNQALLAWQPGAEPEVGRQLVDSLIGAGRFDDAQIHLQEVALRTRIDLRAERRPTRDVWGLWELQKMISEHKRTLGQARGNMQ